MKDIVSSSEISVELDIVAELEIIKSYSSAALLNAFIKLGEIQKECVLSNFDEGALCLLTSELSYEKLISIMNLINNMKSEIPDKIIESSFTDYIYYLREEEKIVTTEKKDKLLASIYDYVKDKSVKKQMIEILESSNSDLVDEIRRSEVNDEVLKASDDRSIQRLIREIDNSILAVYIKYGDIGLKKKVLSNVSTRMREMLIEDMDFLGVVKTEDIEKTRNRIYFIYRKLVEAGEIIHPFSGTYS